MFDFWKVDFFYFLSVLFAIFKTVSVQKQQKTLKRTHTGTISLKRHFWCVLGKASVAKAVLRSFDLYHMH